MWKIGKGHEYGVKKRLEAHFFPWRTVWKYKEKAGKKRLRHGESPIVHLPRASKPHLSLRFNGTPSLRSHPCIRSGFCCWVFFFFNKTAVSPTFSGVEDPPVHPKTPAFHLQASGAVWDFVCVSVSVSPAYTSCCCIFFPPLNLKLL